MPLMLNAVKIATDVEEAHLIVDCLKKGYVLFGSYSEAAYFEFYHVISCKEVIVPLSDLYEHKMNNLLL